MLKIRKRNKNHAKKARNTVLNKKNKKALSKKKQRKHYFTLKPTINLKNLR